MSLMRWINNGLTVYRAYDSIQNEKRRTVAETQAAETMRRIQAGQVSGQLQQARLGDLWDADEAGLLRPGALFLGVLNDRLLFYNGPEPLLTYGATGTGKFRDVIAANLAHTVGHSVVMTDPKGEGAWCTGTHRARHQGGRVGVVNPWGLHGLPHWRINPLQFLIDEARAGNPVVDEAEEIVAMLFAGTPKDEGGNTWIREEAQELLHLCLVYLAECAPESCTLGTLWDIANSTAAELDNLLGDMIRSAAGSGYVRKKALVFAETYLGEGERSKQLNWVCGKASMAVKLYRLGSPLRDATAATDFDPAILKRAPSTLYLVIPGGKLEGFAQWLSLLVNAIIETVARTPGPVRTTFILDEFGNLPRMPAALKALRLYRSQGVQLWPFVQGRQGLEGDPHDAIPRYGKSGRKEFEDQAAIHQMWGVEDTEHARELEARAGYRSVIVPGFSHSTSMQAPGSGLSVSEQVTPVLPVSEISGIAEGRQILRMKGKRLWIAERHPWWQFDQWADVIRPLPEHAGMQRR